MLFPTRMIAATALILVPLGAFAVGTDTSDTPKPTETTTECEDGQIWDKELKACVDPEESRLDDNGLFDAARELAFAGQYENAITVLYQARNRNDPRILNYLGYTNRQAGRMEVALGYYRQALAIDPDYVLARSYMGQALVILGRLSEAEDQLLEIRARSGQGTWAEAALSNALSDAGFRSSY